MKVTCMHDKLILVYRAAIERRSARDAYLDATKVSVAKAALDRWNKAEEELDRTLDEGQRTPLETYKGYSPAHVEECKKEWISNLTDIMRLNNVITQTDFDTLSYWSRLACEEEARLIRELRAKLNKETA